MANGFPPIPVYPKGYDDDSTLFLVYNTAETITTADSPAWADEIFIKPVAADADEIWADNGYANIDGELFYYDLVEKNDNDKIFKLKRCVRNLGGTKTKNNLAGSEVRGYVVAEHHNQLSLAINKIENFVGTDGSTDDTLDKRIDDLVKVKAILDDHNCPVVEFSYEVTANDPSTGTIIAYKIVIDGQYTFFRLDFGDGSSTSSIENGTHKYSTNSTVDPIITISNKDCSIVQSPTIRLSSVEPEIPEQIDTFDIAIPVIPNIPPFVIPDFTPPQNALNFPPIVFPCLDIGSFPDVNIPSIITFDPDFSFPSMIDIGPIDINFSDINIAPFSIPDVVITPFAIPDIDFSAPPSIPDIDFGTPPSIPNIEFGTPPSFPDIEFATVTFPDVYVEPIEVNVDVNVQISNIELLAPSTIELVASSIAIEWGMPPSLIVDWGVPPIISCIISVVCPGGTPMMARLNGNSEDGYDPIVQESMGLNIPSEIKLIVPKIPDLRVIHDIPEIIRVEKLKLEVPDIHLDTTDLPKSIKLELDSNIPNVIILDGSSVRESIKVIGMPDSIELVSKISQIQLVMPENPQIEMVYNGPPIQMAPVEFKIQMDSSKLTGESNGNCFSLVPCGAK